MIKLRIKLELEQERIARKEQLTVVSNQVASLTKDIDQIHLSTLITNFKKKLRIRKFPRLRNCRPYQKLRDLKVSHLKALKKARNNVTNFDCIRYVPFKTSTSTGLNKEGINIIFVFSAFENL